MYVHAYMYLHKQFRGLSPMGPPRSWKVEFDCGVAVAGRKELG